MPRPLGPRKGVLMNLMPPQEGGRFVRRCINCGLSRFEWIGACKMLVCNRKPTTIQTADTAEREVCSGWRAV